MLRLKKGPNLPGPTFPTLPISYNFFIFLNNYSLREPPLHTPRIFFATHHRDPISRLTIATPFRDSHSRLHFATHLRDSISRLPFANPFRDSRSRPHSRLLFATPDRAPTRDSRQTDGRTVLTPQRHLPSVPTLTLIKKFGTYSLACPHPQTP